MDELLVSGPTVVGTDPMVPAKMDDDAVVVVGMVIEESTELALAESSLLVAGSNVILGTWEPEVPG